MSNQFWQKNRFFLTFLFFFSPIHLKVIRQCRKNSVFKRLSRVFHRWQLPSLSNECLGKPARVAIQKGRPHRGGWDTAVSENHGTRLQFLRFAQKEKQPVPIRHPSVLNSYPTYCHKRFFPRFYWMGLKKGVIYLSCRYGFPRRATLEDLSLEDIEDIEVLP